MDQFQPSKDLQKNIILQIRKEEYRRAKNYLIASFATVVVSVVGVVFSIRYVLQGISEASFYRYMSLLFSDPDIVLSYWRQFMLSLVESLPFFAITLVLVATVAFMISIRAFAQSMNSRQGLSISFN